jgi:AcrR family transcriptional regulator
VRAKPGAQAAGRTGARPGGGPEARADEARGSRRRQTRAERSESTLRALFAAAAEVVGEVGYADASIARITSRAGVAQGTFYNYFASRQDLFDQLLPRLGETMLEYIKAHVDPCLRGAEREVARMRAYLRFLEEHPEFYRMLYEAETLAPAAHAKHMETIAGGFVRSLRRSLDRGEMPDGFEERDLEPIVYVLLAARAYLSMRYGAGRDRGEGGAVPDWVVRAYGKLVRHGLLRDAPAEPARDDGDADG